MQCDLKIPIALVIITSTILTFCLYAYNLKRILNYSDQVFKHTTAARYSFFKCTITFAETLVVAAHGCIAVTLLVSSEDEATLFGSCGIASIFLGSYIVLGIGMITWPLTMPLNVSPSFPDATDVCEYIAAAGAIGASASLATPKTFSAHHVLIFACMGYLTTKYLLLDAFVWGIYKSNARNAMLTTRTSQVYRPLSNFA